MALLLLSGLTLTAIALCPAGAQSSPPARAPSVDPYAAHVVEASRRFDIPASWISAVMQAESAGDSRAVSPDGAMGLMQVMPGTWAELRARYDLGPDPHDPHDNILAGTAYLREMWDRYGDVPAMLAAYNAGPTSYDEHRASGNLMPAATQAYVDALTPILRVEPPPKRTSAVARPLDWREATIFVVRDDGAGTPPDRSLGGARSPAPPTSRPLNAGPPHGLFVVRGDAGGRP